MPFLSRHVFLHLPDGSREYGIYHKDTKGKCSIYFPKAKKRVRTQTNRIYAGEILALATCFGVPADQIRANEYEG